MKLRHLLIFLMFSVFSSAQTVVDIVVNSEDHTILEQAVVAADLAGTLSGEGPFTLFAPTDAAFAALPEGTVEALLEDPSGALTDILLYHAVGAKALSSDLSDGQVITTINGKDVTVTINTDGVFINDAQVIMANQEADNGVVHVIDAVLLPPSPTVFDQIADSPDHNTLETLLIATGLDEALSSEGTFTVFAPNDAAFSVLDQPTIDFLLSDPTGLLTDILQYHVMGSTVLSTDLSDKLIGTSISNLEFVIRTNGPTPTINGAPITGVDIEGTNGVVHVIENFIVPTTSASIIEGSPGFTVLSAVLQATGLNVTLAQPDTRTTLFAPTDEAFQFIPEDILVSILSSGDKLVNTLLYHVLNGRTFADELVDGQIVNTLQGEDTEITINENGEVFINDAQITQTDVFTTNGIIHVIDAVLLPAPTTVMDVVIRSEDHTVLQIALDTTNLSGTLQGEGPFTVFAPTDAAFGELPAETINALLADPDGQLTDILLYHVLGSEVLSTDLSDGMTATTLNGADIDVSFDEELIFINGAQVIAADIVTENGIVHVIDVVLLPPVATTELPQSEANVYPSPANNVINVDFVDSQFENPTIYIIDNQGRAIRNVRNAKSGQIVDVSDMQNGMYTVVISDDKYSITKRITKID